MVNVCPRQPARPESRCPTTRPGPAGGREGSREASEALFEKHRGVAFRVAYRLLGQRARRTRRRSGRDAQGVHRAGTLTVGAVFGPGSSGSSRTPPSTWVVNGGGPSSGSEAGTIRAERRVEITGHPRAERPGRPTSRPTTPPGTSIAKTFVGCSTPRSRGSARSFASPSSCSPRPGSVIKKSPNRKAYRSGP